MVWSFGALGHSAATSDIDGAEEASSLQLKNISFESFSSLKCTILRDSKPSSTCFAFAVLAHVGIPQEASSATLQRQGSQ